MLVVSRFAVAEDVGEFAARARAALEALAARPGFRRGHAGRAVDEPTEWVLVTEWDGVGAYRRALSAYEVKVAASPLLAQAKDEPGAYEVLIDADPSGVTATAASDRAPDAATTGPDRGIPGRAARVAADDSRAQEDR